MERVYIIRSPVRRLNREPIEICLNWLNRKRLWQNPDRVNREEGITLIRMLGFRFSCLCLAVATCSALATAQQEPKYIVNSIGMRFVTIPAGDGVIGSPAAESFRRTDEPMRAAHIPEPLKMGAHPVTQGQYFRVLGLRPSWFAPDGPGRKSVVGLNTDDLPVERVTWIDAQRFCTALSAMPEEEKNHRHYRLPADAEFEYAARAGGGSLQAGIGSLQANFNGDYPYGDAAREPYLARTSPVGSYRPNRFGLFDMQGNVWQWCSDWYSEEADGLLKPGAFPQRVLKGCGWNAFGIHCRLAAREKDNPNNRTGFVGFRVVMEEDAHE
jgi:formylglycine-generating enzyme required for sulfatase activity